MIRIGKMDQQEKVNYMLTERIPVLIGKLSVPTMISMIITAVYNMADTFFVGKISTQATAAVGLVFPIMDRELLFQESWGRENPMKPQRWHPQLSFMLFL